MAKYKILGFDPASTRNIGWSIIVLNKKPSKSAEIEEWIGGTFVMPVQGERWQVLWPMFALVDTFIEEQEPELIVIEKTNHFKGSFITGQVSQCMGVILAACGKHKTPVELVMPTSVKKVVSGNGRAKKAEMKKAVKDLLGDAGVQDIKFHSEHTADATAGIFYWLIKNNVIPPREEG